VPFLVICVNVVFYAISQNYKIVTPNNIAGFNLIVYMTKMCVLLGCFLKKVQKDFTQRRQDAKANETFK